MDSCETSITYSSFVPCKSIVRFRCHRVYEPSDSPGEMETGKLLRSIRLIRVASIHLKPYTAAFPIKKPEISSINPVDFGINRCKRNEGLRNNKFRDRITIIALCIRVEELSLIAMHLYFTAQFETTKVNSLSGNQEIPSLYILLIKLIYLISLFSHTFVTPLQENNTLRRN